MELDSSVAPPCNQGRKCTRVTCAAVCCRTPSAAAPGDVSGARLELVSSTALASTVESLSVLRGRSSRQKDALLLTFRQAPEAGWGMPGSWVPEHHHDRQQRAASAALRWSDSCSFSRGSSCVSEGSVQGAVADLQRQAHEAGWGMPGSCQIHCQQNPVNDRRQMPAWDQRAVARTSWVHCEQCGQGHTERPAARLGALQLTPLRKLQAASTWLLSCKLPHHPVIGPAGLRVLGSPSAATAAPLRDHAVHGSCRGSRLGCQS